MQPGVPRILQWKGFTSWGMAKRSIGDVCLPVGSRDKAPVGVLGDEVPPPPEAEAKCEISVLLLTFSCRKFRI